MPAQDLTGSMQPFGDTGVSSAQVEWAGLAAVQTRFPPGFDGAAMAAAAGIDPYCQVPHWGVLLSGSVTIQYSDGTQEVARAGEVFHMPAGHTPLVSLEGAELIEFSPADALAAQVAKMAAAFGASRAERP